MSFIRFLMRVGVYARYAIRLAWRGRKHGRVITMMTWAPLPAIPTALQLHGFYNQIDKAFEQLEPERLEPEPEELLS